MHVKYWTAVSLNQVLLMIRTLHYYLQRQRKRGEGVEGTLVTLALQMLEVPGSSA